MREIWKTEKGEMIPYEMDYQSLKQLAENRNLINQEEDNDNR